MLLALILLTQLDGSPVWVESSVVQIVKTRGAECGPGVGTVIVTGARALCVKEKENVVRDKIEKTK